MNLFILGNGFDLNHKLPTRYTDLRTYLVKHYVSHAEKLDRFSIPAIPQDHKLHEIIDESTKIDLVQLFVDLLDDCYNYVNTSDTDDKDMWKFFESYLGNLNYQKCFNDDCFCRLSWDDENDYTRKIAGINAEYNAQNLYQCLTLTINSALNEWLQTIDIHSIAPKKSFIELIDSENDLFLTFNYTLVLEKIYNCQKVWHFHGKLNSSPNNYEPNSKWPLENRLITGYGKGKIYYDDSNIPIEAQDAIQLLSDQLKKPVSDVIKNNKDFYETIKHNTINNVYFYGFSFAEVDLPYIKHIIDTFKDLDNITFFLHNYAFDNPNERKSIGNILKAIGYGKPLQRFAVED